MEANFGQSKDMLLHPDWKNKLLYPGRSRIQHLRVSRHHYEKNLDRILENITPDIPSQARGMQA